MPFLVSTSSSLAIVMAKTLTKETFITIVAICVRVADRHAEHSNQLHGDPTVGPRPNKVWSRGQKWK